MVGLVTRKLVSNHVSLCMLETCSSMIEVLQIHAQMITTGHILNNFNASNLVAYCALSESGDINYAHSIFMQIPEPSCFIFNIMIRGFAKGKYPWHSLFLYSQMLNRNVSPDHHTFPFVVKACGRIPSIEHGKTVHGTLVKVSLESDSFVRSSLINMYTNCGSVDLAHQVFSEIHDFNIASSNAMISSYLKVGDLNSALHVFDKMIEKDPISCNTVIAGCVKLEKLSMAVEFYKKMRDMNVSPDKTTISSMLSACAEMGVLDMGKGFHTYLHRFNIETDITLNTSLIDMYSKCGEIDIALKVLKLMPKKDTMAWNAVIMGLAMNGEGKKSLVMFREMLKDGHKPDSVTFIGVLCACSHAGLLDEGKGYFELMTQNYKIKPKIKHYGCMVDLFSRAGLFKEAREFINQMPIEPSSAIWGALLGGCAIYGNMELGGQIGKHLIELEPKHSGRYVLLANMYAKSNRWDDARNVRETMEDNDVLKISGQSVIELKGIAYHFVVGDKSYPQVKEIYLKVEEITKKLRLSGYIPDASMSLFNLDEEEKENALVYHSEKLAIAFGLINLRPSIPIRIVKNLRVCIDCHSFLKLVSKEYRRRIIVRDRCRFHHFENGTCSCNDYW